MAEARRQDGEPIRVYVGVVHGSPQHTIELAVAVDGRGTILRVLPLTVSGYAHVVDPEARLFAPLAGSSLSEAAKAADQRAEQATLEAPVWQSTSLLLAAIAAEVAPKPPPH